MTMRQFFITLPPGRHKTMLVHAMNFQLREFAERELGTITAKELQSMLSVGGVGWRTVSQLADKIREINPSLGIVEEKHIHRAKKNSITVSGNDHDVKVQGICSGCQAAVVVIGWRSHAR